VSLSSHHKRLIELLCASEQPHELLPIRGTHPQRLRRPLATAVERLLGEEADPRVLVVVSRPATVSNWCDSFKWVTSLTVFDSEGGRAGWPSSAQVRVLSVADSARYYDDLLTVGYDLLVSDRVVDHAVGQGPLQRLAARHWQLVKAEALEEDELDQLGLPGRWLLGLLPQTPGPRQRLSGLAERVT